MDALVTTLKALAHGERLRILALLSHGELTVSELTEILGLSQPRVTQYIKALEGAGIIERLKEGSWVFSRLKRGQAGVSALVATTLAVLPEGEVRLAADRQRLDDIRARRAEVARAFFADVANDRGQLGDEYLPQRDIEAAIIDSLGEGPLGRLVDLGTGTGRMLTLLAERVERGIGLDTSPDMLRVARHRLGERPHLELRQGDLQAAPLEPGSADLATLHQVLHYLDEPGDAIGEAARLLAPGGRLLVVDFATHAREEFRDAYAHRRLGFSDAEIACALAERGLDMETTRTVRALNRPDVKIWLGRKPVCRPAAREPVRKEIKA